MRVMKTYIGWLTDKMTVVRDCKSLTMALLLILLASCASYDKESQHEPAVLKIYVFAPDRPIVTRGDNGNVITPYEEIAAAESAIKSLSVWVFEHSDGKIVGYINSTTEQLSSGQATLTMEVSDDFASRKPNVDVYVMANVTNANCGLTLNGSTSRADLDAALIGSSYYGLSSLVTPDVITADGYAGLPMSGVKKDLPVFGDAPVFGAGYENTLYNVKLVRAVSKVQFVFTAIDDIDETHKHTVESITLNADMIPTTEYLFLSDAYSAEGGGDPPTYSGYRYKVGSIYNESAATLMNTSTNINVCDPERGADYYVYKTQTGQDYENLIADGLTTIRTGRDNPDLTSCGTYYLRESDKQITGTIYYDIDETTNTPKTATFSLTTAGDFGRNHTWIVYGYFTEKLGLLKVNIKVKEWETLDPLPHTVYNW